MMNSLKKYRGGNILAAIVCILGVIFTISVFYGSATVDRTRQSRRALGGDQAASLAEAGIMRGVHMMSKAMNSTTAFAKDAESTSFAVLLRYPLPIMAGKTNDNAIELGKDDMLDVSVMEAEGFSPKVELALADLRVKPEGEDWLDEMVLYASDGKVESYDLNVTFEIEQAFRMNPKPPETGSYEVPGIDCEFSIRPDVKDFLDNKGRLNFILEFPEWLSLFNFSIPIQVWIPIIDKRITLATIDPAPIIDVAIKPLTRGTRLADEMNCPDGIGINDYFVLDKIMRALFHRILGKPEFYPIKKWFDKEFFMQAADLWPAGVNVPNDHSRYVEKYGTLKVTSVARINFKDGTFSQRKIDATKDFKVSDTEPMAPLYSFFCANTTNDRVNFNDNGGQFYVNNSSGRILSKEQREARKEIAGQIRVNFKPEDFIDENTPGTPIVVNAGLMGHYDGPDLAGNALGNGAMNLAAGSDGLMVLGRHTSAIISRATYNVDTTINSRNVNTKKGSPLPKELKFSRGRVQHGFQFSSTALPNVKQLQKDPNYVANRKRYQSSALKQRNDSYKWWTQEPHKMSHEDYLKKKGDSINFLPDPERFSSNIIMFGVSMAFRGMGESLTDISKGAVRFGSNPPLDAFSRMMLPWMGTRNSYYCLPTLGWGQNKTHFFGTYAWYPTLSRDIEGMIAKRYRQWHVTIVGLFAKDRLPLLPFPPPWCFVPPIPVPFWFSDQIINKYDYNMFFMKAYDPADDASDINMSMYDPDYMINMPANYYSIEQYAKKSNYYYTDEQNFMKDLPNRMIEIDGKQALELNGVTFIAGSLGSDSEPFVAPGGGDTFYVTGKGMIVVSGNVSLGCHIKCIDEPEKRTVFSLIVRNGGMVITNPGEFVFEGSLYTNRGLYIGSNTKLNIQGNWVTNEFAKHRMRGEVMIDYVASRVRSSLGSLHPVTGKYDPRRYHLALSPRWNAWKVD
jgi:hypothetical protein